MTFYRKYRPQTLDDLVGQQSVKTALKSELVKDKLAHAYLFCGPRGTGKTSTARILAKIVNCESQEKQESPCNKCSSCISITDGSNLDVVEMDAASNRGIEDIRVLRENIKLSPTSSKKKVYIIDEVHMLSNDAFNALLKTLEEPPSHVLFILATTEVSKIPSTILSRVTRLDFKQASIEDLVEALSRIVKAENIKIDSGALLVLAKKAQGSFRDGIKFLDLMSGFENINQKTVEEILCTGFFENTLSILESIGGKKAGEGLKKISELQTGVNAKELSLGILDMLRQLIFIKHGLGQQLVKVEMEAEKYVILENLALKFDLKQLIYVIDCFQKCLEQFRFVSIPTLPLELAIVESCQSNQSEHRPSIVTAKNETIEIASFPLAPCNDKKNEALESGSQQLKEEPLVLNQSFDIQKIQDKWSYIQETIRAYNYSLEALLRSSKIKECGEHSIVIEVPYTFHQRIIEAPKSRDLLESIFSDILGRTIKISTILNSHMVQREEIANVEVAADDEIIRIAAEIFNSEPN